MFETAVDQADGLRRLFVSAGVAVVPVGCCAPAGPCRTYAAGLMERLAGDGFSPVLFDRLDLARELGDVQPHPPVDRVLLLDEPVRLARWIRGRSPAMLLLLSHRPDALPDQYSTIKSIALSHGVRRFATLFVDAPGAGQGTRAWRQLAACARRFLDVEIEPLGASGVGGPVVDVPSAAALQRFEVPLRHPSACAPLAPASGSFSH